MMLLFQLRLFWAVLPANRPQAVHVWCSKGTAERWGGMCTIP
jgi:hypothetical protein